MDMNNITIANETARVAIEALRLSINRGEKLARKYDDIDDEGDATTWLAQFGYSIVTLMKEIHANYAAKDRMEFLLRSQVEITKFQG
jgi:hypothetical protein